MTATATAGGRCLFRSGLECDILGIFVYRSVFVSRIHRPPGSFNICALGFTFLSQCARLYLCLIFLNSRFRIRIPLVPAVIEPAGNRSVFFLRNLELLIAGHFGSLRKGEGCIILQIKVITCILSGVVIQGTVFSNIDRPLGNCRVSKVSCKNAAAISGCCISLYNCANAKVDRDKSILCIFLKVNENTCAIRGSVVADRAIFYCDNLFFSCIAIVPCHETAAIMSCDIILNFRIILQFKLSITCMLSQRKNACTYCCVIPNDRNIIKYSACWGVSTDAATLISGVIFNSRIFNRYFACCADINTAANTGIIEYLISLNERPGDFMTTTHRFLGVRQINTRTLEPLIVLNFGINDLQGCVFHMNATAFIIGSILIDLTLLHDQFFAFHCINATTATRGCVFSHR